MNPLRDLLNAGEPLQDTLGRILAFARNADAGDAFAPSAALELARIVKKRGLDVRTVHSLHAASYPHRVALVDDFGSITYGEADRRINQIANALQNAGVRRGERVLLVLENRADYVLTWFALFRIGASAIHTSYRATADEIAFLLDHSGSRFMLVSSRTREAGCAAAKTLSQPPAIWDIDGGDPSLRDFPREVDHASASPPKHLPEGRGDNIVYTSGTTGRPKGAVRDFTSFGLVELSRLLVNMPVKFGDRHLVVSPLYHSAAQAFTLINSALAGTIYLHAQFDAAETLDTLHNHRIHSMFMVPTMIRRVLDLPEDFRAARRPGAFRVLVSGAAPFPHALRLRAIAYFGADVIFDFYGATELGWVTLINGREMVAREGSVGQALPGQEIRIVDSNSRAPLGPREVGTVYVKNAQTMAGYLDDRAASERTRDGEWLTVDDLGFLDEDGFLYLAGRDRDMIISGGVNIYPVEIEEVLAHHPDVNEVAVVGIPDDEWGERLVGVIGTSLSMPPGDIESWARERLAGHKVPREWHVVESLPRNATGKVLKRQLRESILDGA